MKLLRYYDPRYAKKEVAIGETKEYNCEQLRLDYTSKSFLNLVIRAKLLGLKEQGYDWFSSASGGVLGINQQAFKFLRKKDNAEFYIFGLDSFLSSNFLGQYRDRSLESCAHFFDIKNHLEGAEGKLFLGEKFRKKKKLVQVLTEENSWGTYVDPNFPIYDSGTHIQRDVRSTISYNPRIKLGGREEIGRYVDCDVIDLDKANSSS